MRARGDARKGGADANKGGARARRGVQAARLLGAARAGLPGLALFSLGAPALRAYFAALARRIVHGFHAVARRRYPLQPP